MGEDLDVFINQFYGKYSPNDIPDGDRRLRLKEKLTSDFDGYVSQMYSKYAPDNIPDSARLSNLRTKYLPAPAKIDPRVASAFAPQQRYKEFEKKRNELVDIEVADVKAFAESRKKELQAMATPDNVDSLNKQLREEITYYAGQADAKVNNASKELFDPVEEAITAPTPEPVDNRWGVTKMMDAGGRTLISGLVDQLPMMASNLDLKEGPKDLYGFFDQEIEPTTITDDPKILKYRKEFNSWKINNSDTLFEGSIIPTPKFSQEEMVDKFLDNNYPQEKEGIKSKIADVVHGKRVGLLKEVDSQKKEAEEKMRGIVQSIGDVNSLSDVGEYVASMGAQALYQIPISILTKGAGSILMEQAAIYDQKLSKIEEDTGLSREEILKRGLDRETTTEAVLGLVAGGLDAVSANKIFKSISATPVSKLRAWLTSTGVEAGTEPIQGIMEEVSSSVGAGRPATKDLFTQKSLVSRVDEFLGGAIGGGLVGSTMAFTKTNEAIKETPVAPEVAIEQDKALADTLTELEVEKSVTPEALAKAEEIQEDSTLDRTAPIVEEIEQSEDLIDDEDAVAEQGVDTLLEDRTPAPKAELGLITTPEVLSKPYEGNKKIEDAQKPIATRLEKLNELMNCLYS